MKRKIRNSLLMLALAAPTAWANMGLLDVWKLAAQHDARLAQARAQYEADRLQLQRARAALLPQVSLSASLSDSRSDSASSQVRTRQLSLNVRQALYNRKAFVAYDIAKQQVRQAELVWRQAQQDLMTRVVKAYFDVLLAQANVRLTRALETSNRLQWQRALMSEKVGLAASTDVLQARSAYDLARADRIKAENALETAYENLAKLTGRRITALKAIRADRPPPKPDLTARRWLDAARAHNLSLRIAARQRAQAELNVALEKGDYYPTLALVGSVTDKHFDDYDPRYQLFYNDSRATQVALQLDWPLFSGGLTQATVAQARARLEKARQAARDAREATALRVRVLLSNLRNGYALAEALRAAVASSRAFLEAAEESHRVGLKSLLDVLSARANANRAERDLIGALNELAVNRIELEAAVGDLDETDLRRLEVWLVEGGASP